MPPDSHRRERLPRMADASLPLTDLSELSRDILVKEPSGALPCNLPLHWLQRIARDLDACWEDSEPAEEHAVYTAGPLALVLHLLLGKAGTSSGTVSFEDLDRYFREFRIEVHLELISRLTNVSAEPANLASIFERQALTVSLVPDWDPRTV